MELKLDVVLSSSIKRKKPWPRFCWLGQEKESVFLLDDKRISEINMLSGRTRKRMPKLHPLLNSVVKMASSHNGMWLCGLLVSGELFLWNRDKDLLKTAVAVPEIVQMINSAQGNSQKFCIQVSCNGMRVLLAAVTGQVFLWECTELRNFPGLRDGPVKGRWAHLLPLEDTILPSSKDKEASQHTIFVKTEAMADICLSSFVFTSGKQLVVTILKIEWNQQTVKMGSIGYNIQWATKRYPMSHLCPPCQPVKSRGALVPAFSPDGRLLAIVLNQRKPKDTQVLFVSTQNFVSVSSDLGGCGSKKIDIPSKYVRSYWVGSVCWSAEGLFFACVLKRGSLLMLARLSGLLTLTSSGCNVDFGPGQFLPLHPLVSYRPPLSAENREASLSSSSLSVRDLLRQRFSVTWHPRLPYLIVSDGYMATVMKLKERPSPALFLRTVLKETSKDLEKASCKLEKSQVHVKGWLESMPWFNSNSSLEELSATVTCRARPSDSTNSAATDLTGLPLFLQDQQTLGGTKELLENMQAFFEEESDFEGLPAALHAQEGGRLEFASMFDSLHAMDTHSELVDTNPRKTQTNTRKSLFAELGKIKRKLLTAWAFAMSMGEAVEHRAHLLKHTLGCVLWFAALLHLVPPRKKNAPVFEQSLHLIKALLSFLSWDSATADGGSCLGVMVQFSERIVRLLLTPQPDVRLTGRSLVSSQSLSRIMEILRLVSDSLDSSYSLKPKTFWSSEGVFSSSQPHLWSSDVHHAPLLQDLNEDRSGFDHQKLPVPQRPSSRLLGVWQLVYCVTQQYAKDLKRFDGIDGLKEEEQKLSVITSQLQAALQAAGGNLKEDRSLLNYEGENLNLCGFYPQSTQMLRLQICQEASKGGKRSDYQETRLCLALLYNLLSQYHLREAQEFGDHMAQQILLRAGTWTNGSTCNSDPFPCSWLPVDLPSDAALAVVQALGRFMASYFTNLPVFILPAHNVAVLPPLHLPHASGIGRLVSLCQAEVAKAVRQQHLSEVWTVDYALDLLLLGGLMPEAVWLASHLGDWKTAVILSLAYTNYCTKHFDFTRLRRRDFLLPEELQTESIFQAELKGLLCSQTNARVWTDKDGDDRFTDPLDGEDWELLQASVHEILKASAMAGVNIISFPLSSLLDKAKEMCSLMPTLVPNEVYLPSPPLYCPQPSPNTQDQVVETGQLAELVYRQKVSGVLQRLLLLLRSAHCCRPAAQWYITQLRRARHVLHKIKKKYSYPSAAQDEKNLPEGLMKLISRSGFFRRDTNKDDVHLDVDAIQTIVCFRELCALCWMLHVRDQLSLHCRKYQAARQRDGEDAIPDDLQVNSASVDALNWACRLLPFTHFLNNEEVLQDVMLSLLSELPPLSLVAEALVQAFPQEEESVRVSLREKYNLLLQRLGQCNLLDEGEENKLMGSFIQERKRYRRKHLARLQRHLASPVLHLWEKADEDVVRGGRNDMATLGQLSLGPTVSTSTLTDGAFPVCSDGDTAVDTPEAISATQQHADRGRSKEDRHKTGSKKESVLKENTRMSGVTGKEQLSLPVVGSWEFELEDEEYLNFLELFLSYVLEKDTVDAMDCGDELPLLKGFCSQLREKELHSLAFDVVSTIHRRQRGGHLVEGKHSTKPPSVFRAGCSYRPTKQEKTPEPQTSFVWSEDPVSRASFSVSFHPRQQNGKDKGLFSYRQQSNVSSVREKEPSVGSEISFVQKAFTIEHPTESLIPGFSSSVQAVTDLQQGLDPELEARFPELGRLLEWMVRWADRRTLLGHHGKKMKDVPGEPDKGVVIRVKASAPAILTSLSLLKNRYTGKPKTDTDNYAAYSQHPEMQWTVAPVLPLDAERKMERESSVDTGYPGSTNTPIIGPDHNVQQEESYPNSVSDELEELMFPPPAEKVQFKYGSPQIHPSPPPLTFDDLDVTPEKDDGTGDCKDMGGILSDSSEDTSKDVCTPEMSLKLEDLDYSEKDCVSSPSSHYPPVNVELPAPETTHSEPPVCKSSDSGAAPLPNPAADMPSLQPQISVAEVPPAVAATPTQPLIPPPMRQRLGEDLLRLVQHINYMSLSEVLGATFSSLQMAQQSSSLAPPAINPAQHNENVSNAFRVQTTSATAVLQTQPCVPKSQSGDSQVVQTESCHVAAGENRTESQPTRPSGELQPLSVQAESPEIPKMEKRRLIPSSHGLLATTDRSRTVQTQPCDNNAQAGPSAQMLSLKLLKLDHSAISQPSAPHYAHQHARTALTSNLDPPEFSQPKVTHYNQSTRKTQGGLQRNGASVQTKHLILNSVHDPPPRNSQAQIWPSGRPISQVVPLLPPAYSTPLSPPIHGLRLLQLQDAPRGSITFPKLTATSAPRLVISAPMTETPIIRLLHLDTGPQMIVPQNIPLNQTSRLMEELTGARMLLKDAEFARLQLPRRDQSDERITKQFNSHTWCSSKRQKRREEKAEVSICLNQSIIPTREAAHIPESEEAAVATEIKPSQDGTGSPDHFLTGQTLLDKVFSTSAELHAFASTRKRPPECHDAFTNTEPGLSPTLQKKSVSVKATITCSTKMQSSQNFPEVLDQDTVENHQEPERQVLDLASRQFISVLDLEDVRQHEDLVPSSTSEARDLPSLPTSAQLHVLATSVISPAAAAGSQSSIPFQNDPLQHRTTKDIPDGSPSFSNAEPTSVPERIALQDDTSEDSSESEICRAVKNLRRVPERAASSSATPWFSSCLSALDTQLAALQNIADHLEMDFSNSRMLVNKIEKLSSDCEFDSKANIGVKKSVRLSVPFKAAWPSRPDADSLSPLRECDENEDEQEDERGVHDDSESSATKPPSHHRTPPGIKDHFSGTYEISPGLADRNRGQTELSDTMEILDELVKEGYLSPSDWDLDPSQTHSQSRRNDHQQHRWTSQKGTLPEKERKELRIWMRRKQRERLAVYQKHRQSLREREHKPFSASSVVRSPNRKQESRGRNREEKEKFLLLKQYSQRTREAFSLANEVLTSSKTEQSSSQICGPPLLSSTWSISNTPPCDPQSLSANAKKSPKSQLGGSPPGLRHSVEGGPTENLSRRLGLDRPVTFLPGDRLSHVTKRGMLSNSRSQSKHHETSQTRVGIQAKTGSKSTFSSGGPLQKRYMKEQTRMKESEAGTHSESTRLEAAQDSSLVLAGILDDGDGVVIGGFSEMEWLEDLSNSAGSSLSRIDWAAIERMMASEED